MTPADPASKDDIARVAHAIWEAEGQPHGRDHEHWVRARQLIAEGWAEAEFPEAMAPDPTEAGARPVQPGFNDARPGIVPTMKDDGGAELRAKPGGRFAKQIADLPEESRQAPAGSEMPGPRDPAPIPPTNAEGFAEIPSDDAGAAHALHADPATPARGEGRRERRANPGRAKARR